MRFVKRITNKQYKFIGFARTIHKSSVKCNKKIRGS